MGLRRGGPRIIASWCRASSTFRGGWHWAPIYEYGSGQPWTDRLGYDANGDGKNSDRPAGVGRNEENGPPFRQLSLRLTKAFPLSGYGGGPR